MRAIRARWLTFVDVRSLHSLVVSISARGLMTFHLADCVSG